MTHVHDFTKVVPRTGRRFIDVVEKIKQNLELATGKKYSGDAADGVISTEWLADGTLLVRVSCNATPCDASKVAEGVARAA